jgi:geranylgeranylglycerol-phosphate geranylgeranyltransferase
MLNKLKLYLESIHITPISWLVGVSGVLMVRFFLESLSNPTSSGYFASDSSTLIHYYLFFMTGLLILLVFFRIVMSNWKNIIPQFIAISSLIIFLPPIIDWVTSRGKGLKMTYFFDTPKEMLYSFLHFGAVGTTIGLRIEIALALVCLGVLVYSVQKSWKRAVISSLSLYFVVFSLASLPGIISFIGQTESLFPNDPIIFIQRSIASSATVANNLHSSLEYPSAVRLFEISFNFIMGKVLLLISIAAASFWFYTSFKEKFKAIVRNSRVERIGHYILTIFVGILISFAMFPSTQLNWNDWLSIIVLCLSFYFSCLFAICVNDIVDEDIDRVSNPGRPLITGVLSKEDMKQMGAVFLLTSLISGFLAGYTAFFFILAFTSLYYIYSAPPTRFKLIPLFSSFIIGLCYLTAILAGFFLVSPVKNVSAFPSKLIVAVVIIIALLSHARDMKDMEGDKAAGVKTVLVLSGEIWGPRIIGVFAALSFILVPVFSGIYSLFVSAVPAALISYYFINKKPYAEKPVVWVYFWFIFGSILLLFL